MPATAAKMTNYNALIFPEFPRTDPLLKPGQQMAWQVHPDLFKQFNPAIDEYVKNGGGVVVYGVCFFQTQLNGMAAMNKMMAPWGAATLHEQVWDPERQYHYKQLFAHDYSWTANLTNHPLTTLSHGHNRRHGIVAFSGRDYLSFTPFHYRHHGISCSQIDTNYFRHDL